MVLILLSMIVAAIAVAISMLHSSFGILANSGTVREETAKAREQAEQSRVAGQTTQDYRE
jgi:cell division protein FtsL